MLDDKLSKDDLYRQIQWYDKRLHICRSLFRKADKKQELYRIDQEKTDLLEKALDEILSFGDGDQMRCCIAKFSKKSLCTGKKNEAVNRLVVWLKSLPFGIQLRIHSTGNGANFRTEILETEFVDRNSK